MFDEAKTFSQKRRNLEIDRVLNNMAYTYEYEDFSQVFGSIEHWDGGSSGYHILSKMILDEMLHEDLIEFRERNIPGERISAYLLKLPAQINVIAMTVKGNRIKSSGGWVKHYNSQHNWPKRTLEYISHGNNLFGFIVSASVVVGTTWGILKACEGREPTGSKQVQVDNQQREDTVAIEKATLPDSLQAD